VLEKEWDPFILVALMAHHTPNSSLVVAPMQYLLTITCYLSFNVAVQVKTTPHLHQVTMYR